MIRYGALLSSPPLAARQPHLAPFTSPALRGGVGMTAFFALNPG